MEGNLIEQFVEKKALDAMNTLVSTQSDDEAVRAAVTVSEAFGEAEPFKSIADMSTGLGKSLPSVSNAIWNCLFRKHG